MNKANRPILHINSYYTYVSESVLRAVIHDRQDRRRPFALDPIHEFFQNEAATALLENK